MLFYSCYKLSQCAFNLPCTWAWDRRTSVCIVLSIEWGTWKDWGRSLSLIWMYLNDWVKYYPCFWVYGYPRSLDKESWLCHPSREGLTQCWQGCLGQWFFRNTASVANAWVSCSYIIGCLWQTSAAVWWYTCVMWSSLPCFCTFAVLLSLHLLTFYFLYSYCCYGLDWLELS